MPDNKTLNPKQYRLRAKLPLIFRVAAITAIGVAVIAVLIGFYRERSKAAFKLKSEHTQLSADVVSEISGYERLETDGGITKYFIKADHAKTFADNHLELDNVYLEVFDKEGVANDKMTADSALYVPEAEKNFTAYLKGNVHIETGEALRIKANDVTYTKVNETALVEELVEFEFGNVRGKAFGADVKMSEKRLYLLSAVEIETFESPELARSNIRYAKLISGSASFDQVTNKIDLKTSVAINIIGKDKTTEIWAERASVDFTGGDPKEKQLKKIELFEGVRIKSADAGASPTDLTAEYALFDKSADRYELRGGPHIVSTANGKKTDIRAAEAIYEMSAGKVALTGGAVVVQEGDQLKGDVLFASLFPDQTVKDAVIRGTASVRQINEERTLNISAPELNVSFGDARRVKNANAIGESSVEIVPVDRKEYTVVTTSAARGIGLSFKNNGLLDQLKTDGRTTIQLNAPNGSPDATNKRITADAVTTLFHANGKDIRKAEAVGNAELFIEPLVADKRYYRTTITAPRFDCDFFPNGNNAETCVAGKKAKAVRVPTVANDRRGTQTISADQLTAKFARISNNVASLTADGNSKFTELDRNAIAKQMTFTQGDEFIRLRGGEPTAWDLRGRARAREIDIDTKNDRSSLRGGVSTTYYSQKQIKNSTPFAVSEKPVYLTAESAEFDHTAEIAVYAGNARGWQENNYVRGDRLVIDQAKGTFRAEGNVQSLIYSSKSKQGTVPTSASAGTMAYDRDRRFLQYKVEVDIRQGTDRITAGSADVYLNDKNEVSRTVVETDVAITQLKRRATGDWAQYTAENEVAILRGNPAIVTDPVNGSSKSGELTFSMGDNRLTSEGKTKQNTSGRTRSVYKIKDLKP